MTSQIRSLPKNAIPAAEVLGGVAINRGFRGLVTGFGLPIPTDGIIGGVVAMVQAGMLSAAAAYVLPRYRKHIGYLFLGGLSEGLGMVVGEVLPMVGLSGCSGAGCISGLGDYLTRRNAVEARPLGGLGDYLTRQNAAEARNLGYTGDYYGESHVQEELAGY